MIQSWVPSLEILRKSELKMEVLCAIPFPHPSLAESDLFHRAWQVNSPDSRVSKIWLVKSLFQIVSCEAVGSTTKVMIWVQGGVGSGGGGGLLLVLEFPQSLKLLSQK